MKAGCGYKSGMKFDGSRLSRVGIPYSGDYLGDKIFVSSEFLDSLWKNFRGHGILNRTPVLCGTVSWVKNFMVHLSTTTTTKILPHEKYPLYGTCKYNAAVY